MDNLHAHIQQQLESIIDDLIFQGYTANELSAPLTNINWWWDESPYQYSIIHTDGMEGTFKHLLRLVEIITGSNTAFNLDLIEQVSTTIESRWEIKRRHEQEDCMQSYQYELQEVVGL